MTKVDFLICGKKGFAVLQQHVQEFGKDSVNCVSSYPDKKVKDDPFDDLLRFCEEQQVLLVRKEDYKPAGNIYRFVIGWQWILPPANNTIVLHDSLLPRYRGFAPLVNSLINGEKQTGVTAFFANDKYDEGDIIDQKAISIEYPLTIGELILKIIPVYNTLVKGIYAELLQGKKLNAIPQDHTKATYSLWRDRQDYNINWDQPAETILQFINAVGYPYEGAASLLNEKKVIIGSAEIYPDVIIENRTPGKVIFIKDGQPVVVCREGLLKITSASIAETGASVIPFTNLRSRFS